MPRLVTATWILIGSTALLAACAGTVLGNREPASGSGPGGKPMRTVTESAVGMPAVASAPIYPVTARVNVSDNYFGTRVEDPYRWLENLDSPRSARLGDGAERAVAAAARSAAAACLAAGSASRSCGTTSASTCR